MSEIHADGGPIPHIPDDLTIPQFFLCTNDPVRPVPKGVTPWLVEDATGRQIGYEEVRAPFGQRPPPAPQHVASANIMHASIRFARGCLESRTSSRHATALVRARDYD